MTEIEYLNLKKSAFDRDGKVCRNCQKRPASEIFIVKPYENITIENVISVCGRCCFAMTNGDGVCRNEARINKAFENLKTARLTKDTPPPLVPYQT